MNRSDLEELAALDAVGALDEDSRRAYLEGMASASEADRAAIVAIYDAANVFTTALMPVTPPPAIKEALLARIRATTEIFSLRAGERQWQSTPVPGVTVQALHHDSTRNTVVLVVRLAPGAVYPGHHHSGPEECYVLAGDVSIQGDRLTAGDFHHAASGTDHGSVSSEHGAELLLVVAAADYHPLT